MSRHIAKAKERRKEKDFRVFLAEEMIYGVRVKINETHIARYHGGIAMSFVETERHAKTGG